ncbi:MAG: hypothetical protein JSV62_06435, partial [Promethearchaeota archaeon]
MENHIKLIKKLKEKFQEKKIDLNLINDLLTFFNFDGIYEWHLVKRYSDIYTLSVLKLKDETLEKDTIFPLIEQILKGEQQFRDYFFKKLNESKVVLDILEVLLGRMNESKFKDLFNESFDQVFVTLNEMLNSTSNSIFFPKTNFWNDPLLSKSIGKNLSLFIREKLIECIEKNDIESFYNIYCHELINGLNLDDTIYLFKHEKTSIFQFILETFEEEEKRRGYNIEFYFDKMEDPIISNHISKAIARYLCEKYINYDDPIYTLGILDYLKKEEVISLLDNPNINFLKILLYHFYRFSEIWTDMERSKFTLQAFLRERGIDQKKIIFDILKGGNMDKISQLWIHGIWDSFYANEFEDFFESRDFNFTEASLKAIHYHFENKIIDEDITFLPEEIINIYQTEIKDQLEKIII